MIGEVIEQAIWITGEEPPELQAQFEKDLRAGLADIAGQYGVIIGPLIMRELKPGQERVPKVPDYIQGPDVRLLVGEATVIGEELKSEGRFIADLDPKVTGDYAAGPPSMEPWQARAIDREVRRKYQ